jgi:hypothetical protein
MKLIRQFFTSPWETMKIEILFWTIVLLLTFLALYLYSPNLMFPTFNMFLNVFLASAVVGIAIAALSWLRRRHKNLFYMLFDFINFIILINLVLTVLNWKQHPDIISLEPEIAWLALLLGFFEYMRRRLSYPEMTDPLIEEFVTEPNSNEYLYKLIIDPKLEL